MINSLPTFKLGPPPSESLSDDTFKVYCRRGESGLEIAIDDVIGDDGWGGGVSAQDITTTLRDNSASPVTVRINSPGGLAYDGLQIYNALATHRGEVTTINEGLAYSAASIIFMAGDKRIVHEASEFGIHRAHGIAMGNQNDLLAVAGFLEGLDNHLISIYSAATGHSAEKVTEWIDGTTNGTMGTMFSGAEAVEAKFADEMIPNKTRESRPESKMESLAAQNRYRMRPVAIQNYREMIDTILDRH